MGVNKVVMNTENGENVLIDLTSDTVTPEALDEGVTAHDASGNSIVGTRNPNYTVTTTGTGEAYLAEVNGITELTAGVRFVMIPHEESSSISPTLNVNGLGAKIIRRRISNSSVTTTFGSTADWIAANKPLKMLFDGVFWIVDDLQRPNAADLYGKVPMANIPDELQSGVVPITNASVGQTVKITAVDENGVPTSWEAVDLPLDENLTAGKVLVSDADGKVTASTTDANEITHFYGSSDEINAALENLEVGTNIYCEDDTEFDQGYNITEDRAVITNADGEFAPSDVTAAELGYLSGATGNVQEQIEALISEYNFVDNTVKLKSINATSFRSVLENSDRNYPCFIAFYNPTDNPFSFNAGFCVAFASGMLFNMKTWALIGFRYTGGVVEAKQISWE